MEATNGKITNSWSLLAFARSHGEMKALYPCKNADGEEFKSCMFFMRNDAGETVATPVGYSRNLGELSASQIVARKDNLQVVERVNNDGEIRYTLCEQGSKGETVCL